MATSARLSYVARFLLLVGACTMQQPRPDESDGSADCVTPLQFGSQTYTMVTGREVGTVAPGRLLGSGRFAPCDDGGGTVGESRAVYALPQVPTEQAVVLVNGRHRGTVYLSAEPPNTAWDAALVRLMRAWSVQPPTR